MNVIKKDLRYAVVSVIAFTVLLGVVYPLVMTGISQVAFPGNANGQLVKIGGKVVGSKEIGQSFSDVVLNKNGKPKTSDGNPVTTPDARFFQTRPSGETPADNAAGTAFANYGPNSTVTLAAIKSNIATYISMNAKYYPGGLTAATVPVDAADTSASGVDPDISVGNADIQAHRIAALDHIALSQVDALVKKYTGKPGLGIFGESGVNVLELNLAIERNARS
jgi:potassium-transporting ATPase KdpC subunit